MMHRTKVKAIIMGLLFTASAAQAANVLPTVKTFTVPTSAISPIPVSAFTATDTDGTVTDYMITESSTKPTATATGWSNTPLTSYTTTKTGAVTLYAWAKDNAAGVSAAKTATTTIVSAHTHNQSDVVGLAASFAAKVDVSALNAGLATKADASALTTKADVSALTAKADVTHTHDALYQKKYSNVISVANIGGDFATIADAMNSITNASASNSYLIKVMPGTFDMGTNRLWVKNYVFIEGSGKGVTKLIATNPNNDYHIFHVRNATSALSNMSIEATSDYYQYSLVNIDINSNFNINDVDMKLSGNYHWLAGVAMFDWGSALKMHNVTIDVKSNFTQAGGGFTAGYVGLGLVEMDNVSINVSGAAYRNAGIDGAITPNSILNNVRIDSSDIGIFAENAPNGPSGGKVINSIIKGTNVSLKITNYSGQSNNMINLLGSQLIGPISNEGGFGTFKAVNCVDGNFDIINPAQ